MLASLAKRLPVVLAALAVMVFALLAAGRPAAAATQPARAADSFVDSIGVNTHTYYTGTAYYERFSELKERLAELGVRHVREELAPNRSDQYQRLKSLAAIGVHSTLIMGEPTIGSSGLDRLLGVVSGELKGTVDALEGTNEYDLRGRADWVSELRGYQRQLYDAAKSTPALSSLPVIGPSIVHWHNQEALGDITSMIDAGNIHSYPDGYAPESNLGNHLSHARTLSGSDPVYATETGYHVALNWSGSHMPVSEAAAATYMPRIFLEYFRRGVVRTFSYQLVDNLPNPELDEREQHFGLLGNDLSEKPAYVALRNTIDVLEDPGPAFAPSSLEYSVDGDKSGLRQVLLQKRDGRFYLALWRDSTVWDPVNRVPTAAPSAPARVSLSRGLSEAAVYAPNDSATPIARYASPNQVSIDVGPEVRIVELTPADTAPGPDSEPESEPKPTPESEPTPEAEPAPSDGGVVEPTPMSPPAPASPPAGGAPGISPLATPTDSTSSTSAEHRGRRAKERRRAKHLRETRRQAKHRKLRRLRAKARQAKRQQLRRQRQADLTRL